MKNFNLRAGKSAFAVAVLSAVALTSCENEMLPESEGFVVSQETQAAASRGGQNFVANEVLVKFKSGVAADARAAALARISGTVKEKIHTKAMEKFGDMEGLVLVHTPMAALEAIGRLKGGAEIEYAEPNYIYQHHVTSNDPYYLDGSLWGMYGSHTSPANQYGSQAGTAWANNHTGSSTVVIGIIDEGVMHTHGDLTANIWTNPGEVAGNGVDDDGNGYIDDVYGWDFDGNDNSTFDGAQDDHGTHVAGTIGGKGGNGTGVAGVAWNVKMITAKFLGRNGGTTANAIKSVDYLTDLKSRHNLHLVASNNSWGGGGFSQALYDAIERSNQANILFIAAAGNGGGDGVGDDNDVTPSYPASYANANIVAVASITSSGAKSGFSNYGATSVDLGAPGSGIYSTLPSRNGSASYGSYSGTSMATPHVTGAAALYAASNTAANAASIKNAIMSNALPTASLSGKCVSGGRLNVSTF